MTSTTVAPRETGASPDGNTFKIFIAGGSSARGDANSDLPASSDTGRQTAARP